MVELRDLPYTAQVVRACWVDRLFLILWGWQVGFAQAVSSAFANYFNFKTRARRSEYWYYFLFLLIAGLVAVLIDFAAFGFRGEGIGPVNGLFSLATFFPTLAVSVRRLHDIGGSGWWILIFLIPFLGVILLIYWACQPGEPGPNRYGNPPA